MSQFFFIIQVPESSETAKGLPELNEENLNITQNPEYDDPVEAVTVHLFLLITILFHAQPKQRAFISLRCLSM